ncbi:winged helix-turn-helix transcriptional regulator [Planotetraspora thailandica]|nr:helix-turn-helix domain-containing protein [Planotetraspora thailandica]
MTDVAEADSPACTYELVRSVLDRVGDKWTVVIVCELGNGPRRFNELRRLASPITQRMLTVTLRGLERDGLVSRTVHPTVPPQVEYALTGVGRTLLTIVRDLADWTEANLDHIRTARAGYDRVQG